MQTNPVPLGQSELIFGIQLTDAGLCLLQRPYCAKILWLHMLPCSVEVDSKTEFLFNQLRHLIRGMETLLGISGTRYGQLTYRIYAFFRGVIIPSVFRPAVEALNDIAPAHSRLFKEVTGIILYHRASFTLGTDDNNY